MHYKPSDRRPQGTSPPESQVKMFKHSTVFFDKIKVSWMAEKRCSENIQNIFH